MFPEHAVDVVEVVPQELQTRVCLEFRLKNDRRIDGNAVAPIPRVGRRRTDEVENRAVGQSIEEVSSTLIRRRQDLAAEPFVNEE